MIQPSLKISIEDLKNIDASDNYIKTFLILLAIISLLGVILPNIKISYDFYDSFSKRQLCVLKESLNDGQVTEPIKKVLQEQVDSILFRQATGIRDHKNLRKQIIELYEFANGRLTYLDFKRAYAFLEHKADGSLEVRKIYYFERIAFVIYWILSILLLFISTFFIYVLLFYNLQSSAQIILLLFSLYFLCIGLVILTQTQPIPISRKIKDELRQKKRKDFDKGQESVSLEKYQALLKDYNSLEETAYLLRSPVNAERLLRSLDQIESGKGVRRELIE